MPHFSRSHFEDIFEKGRGIPPEAESDIDNPNLNLLLSFLFQVFLFLSSFASGTYRIKWTEIQTRFSRLLFIPFPPSHILQVGSLRNFFLLCFCFKETVGPFSVAKALPMKYLQQFQAFVFQSCSLFHFFPILFFFAKIPIRSSLEFLFLPSEFFFPSEQSRQILQSSQRKRKFAAMERKVR